MRVDVSGRQPSINMHISRGGGQGLLLRTLDHTLVNELMFKDYEVCDCLKS